MNATHIWRKSQILRYSALAIFLLAAAVPKFTPAYGVKFVQLGWPHWFRFVVGGIELICALLLMIPSRRTRFWAAGALVLVLTGAVTNQIVMHVPINASLMAPLFLIIVMIVAAANWPADWRELFSAQNAAVARSADTSAPAHE
ncbi:DoxX family protein [Nocardia sp. CY41]|uniref:DoxX family protein n=1 Tax=Nocardia sp. CY41 TaxID=2608686 RepID=UPI001357E4F1|nr:DoxX family protein [Nocardia sp. CY41]